MYNKPEKFMAEAMELVIKFHRCKAFNCAVIWKLYLLLRSTIMSAKGVGLTKMIINE
jgi:hypothetical protein